MSYAPNICDTSEFMSAKRTIVVGASSGIGAALAQELSKQGHVLGLVARREDRLDEIASSLPGEAVTLASDVCSKDAGTDFRRLVDQLGGLDSIYFVAGVMPDVGPKEFNTEKDVLTFDVNVSGMVRWLNPAAEMFQEAGAGSLVAVSSVAGDRGRRGSPAYGASKAAVTTYMESLRNRLSVQGVHVMTVKPGPVETPMTQELGALPFMVKPDLVARTIVKAARKKRNTIYVPGRWRPIMWVIRSIPGFIFRKMNF